MITFHAHTEDQWRTMTARYDLTVCRGCFEPIRPGTKMCWNYANKKAYHHGCHAVYERGRDK